LCFGRGGSPIRSLKAESSAVALVLDSHRPVLGFDSPTGFSVFRLEEHGLPKTDIGLGVPFALSFPPFFFRYVLQSSLLFLLSAVGSSIEAALLGTRENSRDLYGTLIV